MVTGEDTPDLFNEADVLRIMRYAGAQRDWSDVLEQIEPELTFVKASPADLVMTALAILVEARLRATSGAPDSPPFFDGAAEHRLGVAITAAHTVLESPSTPTDELRAMDLWRGP